MVLVCRSVSPVILIAHLPVVCQVARVPLITLNPQVTTRMLAQAIDDATRDTESEKEAAKDAKKPNAHSRRFQLCTTIGILVRRTSTRAHTRCTPRDKWCKVTLSTLGRPRLSRSLCVHMSSFFPSVSVATSSRRCLLCLLSRLFPRCRGWSAA